MKAFSIFKMLAQTSARPCRSIVQQSRRIRHETARPRLYSTARTVPKGKRSRGVIYAAVGAATGIAAIPFAGDVKHGYHAIERSGRVVSALFVNINE